MSKGNDFKRRKKILKYYIKGYLDDIQIFNLFFWKLFALFIDVRSFGKKPLIYADNLGGKKLKKINMDHVR